MRGWCWLGKAGKSAASRRNSNYCLSIFEIHLRALIRKRKEKKKYTDKVRRAIPKICKGVIVSLPCI